MVYLVHLVIKMDVKNLYTRGDGIIGADISYLIQYLDTIPDIIRKYNSKRRINYKKRCF